MHSPTQPQDGRDCQLHSPSPATDARDSLILCFLQATGTQWSNGKEQAAQQNPPLSLSISTLNSLNRQSYSPALHVPGGQAEKGWHEGEQPSHRELTHSYACKTIHWDNKEAINLLASAAVKSSKEQTPALVLDQGHGQVCLSPKPKSRSSLENSGLLCSSLLTTQHHFVIKKQTITDCQHHAAIFSHTTRTHTHTV